MLLNYKTIPTESACNRTSVRTLFQPYNVPSQTSRSTFFIKRNKTTDQTVGNHQLEFSLLL